MIKFSAGGARGAPPAGARSVFEILKSI